MPTDLSPRKYRNQVLPFGWLSCLSLYLALIGGCAMPGPAQRPSAGEVSGEVAAQAARAADEAEVARAAGLQARSRDEPQYLRFKAEETQLAGVVDDGNLTYLEFHARPDQRTEFFDQDGRQLPVAIAGRVAAVGGLHAGILVRQADRASFASPNPRALSLPRRPLPDSAEHAEARALLESQPVQLQAMQRAIEAARTGSASSRRPPPVAAFRVGEPAVTPVVPYPPGLRPTSTLSPVSAAQGAVPFSRPSRFASAAAPVVVYGVAALPSPLASAHASILAAERGVVRVFFATASRAIVAPDDGLGLLLREAAKADEIRVTGFTDATGSRATNDALALARAEAVVRILLRRGVPADRIFSSAAGASDFIADNASEKGRALNRRVEVLMLKNGLPLALDAGARVMR